MKNILLTATIGIISLTTNAQQTDSNYFMNPIIHGDIPDPTMIKIDGTYYAAGTSTEWAPFYPVFKSNDLINWKQIGHIFDKQPEWTINSFWAPELFVINGKIYCYYTAREKATNISYIGVATADSPEGKFTDHGIVVRFGKEAIDPFIFNDNGQLYITWKAYGLDDRPIEILGSKLSADGLRLEGEPFTMLVDENRTGIEGQYIFKKDDYYYLIYAANSCCGYNSDYNVCVARSKKFDSLYENYNGNPILHGGEGDYKSCGHGTGVTTDDGRIFFMCHAYLNGDMFFNGRQPILQELEVTKDKWLKFKTGELAVRKQSLPFKGISQMPVKDFYDDFDGESLKYDWTWNFPFSDVKAELNQGQLYLSGTMKDKSKNGSVLCLRPTSSEYSYETHTLNKGNNTKGLTWYGDDNFMISWGINNNNLELRKVVDGKESVIFSSPFNNKDIYLKTTVEKGSLLKFYYSEDNSKWVCVSDKAIDCKEFIRWDRVPRPGLIHSGNKNEPSVFSYFRYKLTR